MAKKINNYMSISQYAKACGVSVTTIHNRIDNKEIIAEASPVTTFVGRVINTSNYPVTSPKKRGRKNFESNLIEVFCLYKMVNTNNGMVYIGKTGDLDSRIKSHLLSFKSNKHSCKEAQKHYNMGHLFDFSLIKNVSEEQAFLMEFEEIKKIDPKKLYNNHKSATKKQMIVKNIA